AGADSAGWVNSAGSRNSSDSAGREGADGGSARQSRRSRSRHVHPWSVFNLISPALVSARQSGKSAKTCPARSYAPQPVRVGHLDVAEMSDSLPPTTRRTNLWTKVLYPHAKGCHQIVIGVKIGTCVARCWTPRSRSVRS